MLEADLDNGSALLTSDDDEQFSWIEWFCKLKGNEFFGQVDEDYIRDEFNLTGLSAQVPCYDRAMDMILDNEEDDDSSSEDARVLEKAALKLYGLIHARFVLTKRGITVMHPKYQESVFGTCANVYCQNQSVLPIGVTDTPGVHNTKVFCPRCNEIYNPRSKRLAQIDGAFFGTTFACMFFMQSGYLVPKRPPSLYVPKIFGFKVHPGIRDEFRAQIRKHITMTKRQKSTGAR